MGNGSIKYFPLTLGGDRMVCWTCGGMISRWSNFVTSRDSLPSHTYCVSERIMYSMIDTGNWNYLLIAEQIWHLKQPGMKRMDLEAEHSSIINTVVDYGYGDDYHWEVWEEAYQ
mgnify:CR=1 FL=1